MNNAARIGMLVVLFGVLLFGAYAFLQKSFFAPKTQAYFAEFKDAAGITSGAKVLLAGVPIGYVEKVELVTGARARISLQIFEKTEIPKGSVAELPSSLIGIGDRQIELIPPAGGADGSLEPGATIPGQIRSPLAGILPDTKDTLAALNKTLESTNALINDQGLRGDVQKLLQSSQQTAAQFGKLAARLDATLAANQAQINTLARNAAVISDDLAHVSNTFKNYIQGGTLQGNVDTLMKKMMVTVDKGTQLVEDLRAVINDPALQSNLKEIIANTKTMTQSGTQIAENVKAMTAEGTEAMKGAKELMLKANTLVSDANDLLKELRKKLLGGGPATGLADSLKKIEVQADATRSANPDRWRSDFTLKVPVGKENYYVGVWDAFESNKLIAQVGKKNGKAEFRYGVYASKPGLGVDFTLAPRLELRGDLFGLNRTRFDVRARVQITKDVHGWLGLERVFDRTTPSFGIGIRR